MLDDPRAVAASGGGRAPWRAGGPRHTAIAVTALLVAFAQLPQSLPGDDATRAAALRQLAGGVMPDTKYSLIQPLASVPVYWMLDGLGFGTRAITTQPLIWLAVWVFVAWRLLVRYRSEWFAYTSVVLGVVSLQAAYVVGFSADLFSALAMSGGVLAGYLARSVTGRAVGWAVVIVGAANSPALVVPVAAIAVLLTVERRRVRHLVVVPLTLLLIAAEASWSERHFAFTKYSSAVERGEVPLLPWGEVVGFGWPLWSGLLAVLFSFGRGLVFYLPLWVAGPSPTRDDVSRSEHALWIAAALLVPLYAKWWSWYGGVTFGPRFFLLAAVPLAMAAAAAIERTPRTTARSAVLLAAVLLNTWVAIAGGIFGVTRTAFDTCVAEGSFALEPLCWYTPEYSSLWIMLWDGSDLGARHVVYALVVVAVMVPVVVAAARPLIVSARSAVVRLRAATPPPWRF